MLLVENAGARRDPASLDQRAKGHARRAFAALHGLGWGLRGPFMSAIRADYFGRHAIGSILGISAAIAAVGQMTGPLVAGVLADLTGDYRLGFTLLAVLSALGSLAFILATRPGQDEPGQAPVS